MAIKINGKDMKDAVIQTEQYEMRITAISGATMELVVKDTYGESFTFVPRFFRAVYPDKKTVGVTSRETIAIGTRMTVDVKLVFDEALKLDPGSEFQLMYASRKLAVIRVD